MGNECGSQKAGSSKTQPESSLDLEKRGQPEDELGSVTIKKKKRKLKRAVEQKPTAREQTVQIDEVPVAARNRPEASQTISEIIPPRPRCLPTHGPEAIEVTEGPIRKGAEILGEKGIPVIHFDAESGTIRYLKEDNKEPDYVVECSYCGAVVGFDTSTCPICGRRFDEGDTGIVSLVAGTEFDPNCSDEMDCPSCGEHILLIEGRCPACLEIVHGSEENDPDSKVAPVIRGDNVVFLHLNVESGELNYLQRLADRLGFEQLRVQLEDVSHRRFEKD